jgi:hypothetical protein
MTNPPIFTEGIVWCIEDRNAPTVGINISDAIENHKKKTQARAIHKRLKPSQCGIHEVHILCAL